MHKLVILIDDLDDWDALEAEWPRFLHNAEQMPGLLREATSRVVRPLYGNSSYLKMHELFFASLEQAEMALASSQGMAAGRLLQQMTAGRMTLFLAEHKEDDLENIRKYQRGDGDD
ncbi:MAG: hypothetical protein JXA78_12165 [Anaerolineales bacterium]|nr:hypothetical protein [Anaerolineales bacterium]